MSLEWLVIEGIRNLQHVDIQLDKQINLFVGNNGSGKTSILESVYFLGAARSYRHTSVNPLISRDSESCLVRGQVQSKNVNHQIGVSRDRDGTREIRVDSEEVNKATALATLLPLLVLGPETIELLSGSPAVRRRFLNWGLFHVEQSFTAVWERTNRCLKQRNELLRNGRHGQELVTWTQALVESSNELHQLRKNYFEKYKEFFSDESLDLLGLKQVEFTYMPGWNETQALADIYAKDEEIDKKRGFTQRGFQRADVRIRVGGQEAVDCCSRGELKLLSWAMMVIQGALLSKLTRHKLVYLVDDLCAELDEQRQASICNYLLSTKSQILATGIQEEALVKAWQQQSYRLFHVEQGRVDRKPVEPEGKK